MQRPAHQRHPSIPGALVDREGRMTRPEPRMSPPLDVTQGTTESADQEIAQAFFGTREIGRRIHWAENVVGRHLCIERAHEPRKALLANSCKHIVVGHAVDCSAPLMASLRPVHS